MAAASNLPSLLSFPCSTRVPPAWRLRHQPMVFRRSCPPIRRRIARSAYISPPVSDPNVGKIGDDRASTGPSFSGFASETAISWGLLWSLMSKQKLGLAVSFVSLLGCTTCTLSMPILSGRFFEVLVGKRTVGVLYVLEPVFSVIFVVNMSKIWEKVMTALGARVFRRILVQKE